MSLFGKNIVVGVSITPERGLEAAQIDFATKTVVKYGCKEIDYNLATREIADLDIFKQDLRDLLGDLRIPTGAGIIVNIPTVTMNINDYPAALTEEEITVAIEQEIYESPYYKNMEPCFSAALLPSSSMQVNKVAYISGQKSMLIEVAMIIKDIGYKLIAIDTSVNSTLNAMLYLDKATVEPETPWLLLIVENTHCRIMTMMGSTYIDTVEEKLSIGDVLTDAENYSTVISAVEPLIKNMPTRFLYVLSKTNIISAEILANKLTYAAPITNQEANDYLKEPIIKTGPLVETDSKNKISLDVIGAAIYNDFIPYVNYSFNLYNQSLGDIYTDEQPLTITFGGSKIALTASYLLKAFVAFALFAVIVVGLIYQFDVSPKLKAKNEEIVNLDNKIQAVQSFLEANKEISRNEFDEGEQISFGLGQNKNIYSYYTIVGTEIPQKLWLTYLNFNGNKVTIEGQSDNLESVYSFFRAIKDYNPDSNIKLQKLGLANINRNNPLSTKDFDTESLLTSMEADFYAFRISNETENSENKNKKQQSKKVSNGQKQNLPPLESIKE